MAEPWAVTLTTIRGYTPWPPWDVKLGLGVPPPVIWPLPALRAVWSVPFAGKPRQQAHLTLPFAARRHADTAATAPWGMPKHARARLNAAWRQQETRTRRAAAPWGKALPLMPRYLSAGWRQYEARTTATTTPWGTAQTRVQDVAISWQKAAKEDAIRNTLWQDARLRLHILALLPWLPVPPTRPRFFLARWGRRPASTVCRDVYFPFDPWAIELATRLEPVPAPSAVVLATDRSRTQEVCITDPGGRPVTSLPPVIVFPQALARVPILVVYWIMNSVEIYRTADGAPIEAFSISLGLDSTSFTWSARLALASRDAYAAVKPQALEPVELDVIINGHAWRLLIEHMSQEARFPGGSWTATGKSLSAYLAEPYARAKTRLEPAARLAQQCALDELQYTGFSLEWQIPDWLIPANTFSYQGLTPILAVSRLAEAAGGYLQPAPAARGVRALPRYPITPWQLWGSQPDLRITHDPILQYSESLNPRPEVNAVWVSGQQTGVLVAVKRAGTAGNRYPGEPLVTDPLMTDVNTVARARGISILADHLPSSTVSMTLPLSYTGELPGLIQPGTVLEVATGFETWRGIARGVSIQASRAASGELVVSQQLEVERYY